MFNLYLVSTTNETFEVIAKNIKEITDSREVDVNNITSIEKLSNIVNTVYYCSNVNDKKAIYRYVIAKDTKEALEKFCHILDNIVESDDYINITIEKVQNNDNN